MEVGKEEQVRGWQDWSKRVRLCVCVCVLETWSNAEAKFLWTRCLGHDVIMADSLRGVDYITKHFT